MARDIHEVEIFRANELNGRTFEQSVVFFADVGSILDRLSRNLVNVRLCADYSDCAQPIHGSVRLIGGDSDEVRDAP